MDHGALWRPSSTCGENGALQWPHQVQDVPPKFMKGQEEGRQDLPTDLQEYLPSAVHSLHVTAVSRVLHMSVLRTLAEWLDWRPNPPKSPPKHVKKCFIDETKVEPFGHSSKRYVWHIIQDSFSPREHHTHREAWWWQHHGLGWLLFKWDWGCSQDRWNHGPLQISVYFGAKPAGLSY